AELAVPLKIGTHVIGALDVQSKQSNSFDEELVNILEVLAAQVSIAIENVRLYEQTRRQLQEVEKKQDMRVQEDWQDYTNAHHKVTLSSTSGVLTDYDFESLRHQARQKQMGVVGTITERNTIPFVIPISLRGKSLGTVAIEFPAEGFRHDRVLLAEELIQRLAISLDNARLFHATQLSTERERIVNTISTRLTEQSNIEDIIQTAIHELGLALRTPNVGVRLNIAQQTDDESTVVQHGTSDVLPEIEKS
ncbi:MAG: GAF domain-containing protein, partial [Aggregatilineales bacterium]